MSQPEHDPGQYPQAQYGPPVPYPGYQQNYPPEYFQGQKLKETSLIFGIVGLFFLGIVFGPLAISKASKAESLGVPATAGKVLGWIDTVGSGIVVLFFLASFGLGF